MPSLVPEKDLSGNSGSPSFLNGTDDRKVTCVPPSSLSPYT